MKAVEELQKRMRAENAKSRGTRGNWGTQQAAARKAEPHYSEIIALPARSLAPIQDLDVTHTTTFGDFLFMIDYDPIL